MGSRASPPACHCPGLDDGDAARIEVAVDLSNFHFADSIARPLDSVDNVTVAQATCGSRSDA
jgi:hypothetical protein